MTKIRFLMNKLTELKKDALLVSSELNQRYVSGFDYTDGYILITPERAYLLADFRYIEAAHDTVKDPDFEVIMPTGGMIAELSRLIAERNIGTLLIEESVVSCAEHSTYTKNFKNIEIIQGASEIFDGMRLIKTNEELALMIEAQKITDAAFSHILKVMKPDMTEIEVALELEFFMRRNGAENVAFDTIAVSGSASSMPHGVPRNVKLEKGFLTMDFGARYKGYCADMTRTVVIGKADEEIKKVYSTVLTAQKAALDMICENVNCYEVDKCARDIIYAAGYEGCFGHGLGHGVGMLVHENPRLSPSAKRDATLKRGMTTSVEPGIYIAEKYGCRIEDLVAIDQDGKVINMTTSNKEMIELF
ncbi:MAG: aminopeptidase P family protein [Clostridia bacterium]|nr:aminopeptidase P family protein [Clostridia bacterium]